MRTKVSIVLLLVSSAYVVAAAARELTATPGNLRQHVAALQPGDTLMLQPGKYPGGIWLKGLHGRPDAPITIRGQGPDTVLLGREGTNTVDLSDCQWLVLRDLTFDGQGKAVDAIKAGKETTRGCHHITIENNTIINHGANQQIVGISTKSPCSDWTIRGNTILGAGTGIYLGNSDGSQPFVRGTIEYNLIRDPVGYCMQIKHQNPRPNIEALPRGPSTTIIRYNVFIKGDRPSPDGNRPNLLVDGFPSDGPGSQDRYQVYGNVLFHNSRESLFQATGRVSIHDNVFADAPGTAVAVVPHVGKSPRQVFIYHNTFVGVGRAIAVSGTPKEGLAVVANLAVADQKPSVPWPAGNVRMTAEEAAHSIAAPVPQLGKLDVQPRQVIPSTIPAATRDLLRQDMDYTHDFWGAVRDRFDQAGACQPSLQRRVIEAKPRTPPAVAKPAHINKPELTTLVFDLEMYEKAKTNRANALLDAIEKSCQARKVSPGHGHKVLPVAQAILKIKDRVPEIKDADPVLTQVAALLHDIGGGGPPGESKGPPIAKAILIEQRCDSAMIERVCRIIATHHHLKGELDVPVAERPEWFIVIVADRPEVIQRYEAAPADADSLERDVRAWIARLNRDIRWTAASPAKGHSQQTE